jgi:hypothetical protein
MASAGIRCIVVQEEEAAHSALKDFLPAAAGEEAVAGQELAQVKQTFGD